MSKREIRDEHKRAPMEQRPKDLLGCYFWLDDRQFSAVRTWLSDLLDDADWRGQMDDPKGEPCGWAIERDDCRLYVTLAYDVFRKTHFVHLLSSDPPPTLALQVADILIREGCQFDEHGDRRFVEHLHE